VTVHPAVAAAAAAAALGAAWWWNRRVRGWLPDDPPSAGRKQHAAKVPLAGVVLAPVVLPWLCAAGELWLATAAVLACATGWLDDRGKERGAGLDWRWKALGLLAAAAACALGVVDPLDQPLWFCGVVAFAFVLANATNFLDNTDGVAASLSAASLLAVTGGSGPLAAVGFAAIGFLPWNWPRPWLFLGDAGAYLLGILTAAAVARQAVVEPRALLAVAVQLADFAQVVIARLVLGLPPWVGDRRHLTHIAQNLGLPRRAVAPVFTGVALLVVFGWPA